MIVSTSLIRRRDDLTNEQFRRHWLDPHGPLTAQLPGTRYYDQNHVLPDASGTNATARALRIDGFPILAFDNAERRREAHTSPQMAACNLDSRDFIGAVSRVIGDDGSAPRPRSVGLIKQLLLLPSGGAASDLPGLMSMLDGIETSIVHDILEQGAAPNSTVPFIGVDVEAFAEVWTRTRQDIERNAAKLADIAASLATFEVDVVNFIRNG